MVGGLRSTDGAGCPSVTAKTALSIGPTTVAGGGRRAAA
jgi:hypothetical protein